MDDATLTLIELDNPAGGSIEPGGTSHELYLSEFADRVRKLARKKDEVIKIQPHKWCVFLRGVRETQQIELAGAKLKRLFDEPIVVVNEEINARVHAVFVPPDQTTGDTRNRLKIAEAGLRDARNTDTPFVIRGETEIKANQQRNLRVREVEAAIERGEFLMYFQPKMHAAYRNVVGAEALVRWNSPEHGVLPPSEIFPYIERRSTLRALTEFAIKSSLSQCANWPDEVEVAVNLPPQMLMEPGLDTQIADSLAIFGLAPERLTLEITEDAMIEDPERAMCVLQGLRDLGIKMSIDDFGTGYSSLAYFRDLPVDELKVDRSFVSNMLSDKRDLDLVKAIIDLAHNFSLKVVAEGVENAATADALEQLHCDVLQGYHFSKPEPPDVFARKL